MHSKYKITLSYPIDDNVLVSIMVIIVHTSRVTCVQYSTVLYAVRLKNVLI
jgi:hypothetical protein